MKKSKQIEIPILNDEYKVIFTWGTEKEISKVLKYRGHTLNANGLILDNLRGQCFYKQGFHPVIAMPNFPKTNAEIGTLAHEAVHAILEIYKNINEENISSEIFAHSVGAVVRKVLSYGKK